MWALRVSDRNMTNLAAFKISLNHIKQVTSETGSEILLTSYDGKKHKFKIKDARADIMRSLITSLHTGEEYATADLHKDELDMHNGDDNMADLLKQNKPENLMITFLNLKRNQYKQDNYHLV